MQSLYETVKEIVETGRIGIPVFVRCLVEVLPGRESAGNILGKVLAMTCSWLEAFPQEVYARTGKKDSHISVTTRHTGGQTSIVSISMVQDGATRVDLMLLGNKGAIYQDGDALPPGFDIAAEPLPVPEWLMKAVDKSLREGKPAAIKEANELD